MRSSRIGALLGTFSLAFLILVALVLSTFFISHRDLHDRNKTNVPSETMAKNVVEFVRPLKMRPPLHERDVLYPEEESRPQGTNHHSGHFRERMAEIWDPHPEYEFNGFGRRFHLQLAQSQAPFVAKGIKVMHVWENLTVAEEPNLRPEGCFYTGRVKGDPNSQVSVNLCHGMTGHIRTYNENYLIEPAEPWKDLKTPIKHTLQKLPNSQMPMGFDFSNEATERSRKKRSLSKEYYVELMVVVDTEMSRYHGPSLDSYVLNLISIAAMIFKDASIGNHINIAVVKLFKIEDNDIFKKSANEKGSSASTMLRNFCEWQSTHNSPDDSSARHHDSALLLTRKNICWDHLHQPDRCDTLGLAELGTMCESSSCALVRDIGLSAGFTIAHEIGHVLNMPHDDNYKCSTYNAKEDKSYVMSRMLDNNTYPWAWSNCSRHYLTEFLDAGSGDCLLDPPYEDKLPDRFEPGGQYPGEVFNENKQCELLFGKKSKICYSKPVCKTLWCTLDSGNQSHPCKSYNLPWADGTPCGNKQWCQRGHCVKRDPESLYPIDGGWGAWQPYGECSRTCGGGIKKSTRYCNNPAPANGGHYCVGQRKRYQSCGTQECPAGSKDFREQQCAKFNGNNFKIQGLAEDVEWLPKYGGISPEDRCKLYCRVAKSSAYYLLKEKVIDGTVCSPDTYDVCVNGACLAAGCDHELNSTTDLDYCGQCGGNNSTCEQKAGSYNKPKYGYTAVVRIPAGSSNIELKQYSHNNGHDDNYLALKDVDTNQYILNGNYVVSSHHKRIIYGGTTLDYSGSEAVVEKINASRPLTKDLVVEVLSVGNLLPPNIHYIYTVQKSVNKYVWELADDWTRCDKVCHGVSWRDYKCVKAKRGQEVAQELCDYVVRPARIQTECNTNCDLEWEIASRSECTSHCGPGNRTLTFKCVKISLESGNRKTKQHDSVCSHLQKPNDTEKCEGPCYRVGWHYGSWSPCSETCGPGRRFREARCVDEKNRVIDDRNCMENKKTEEICEISPCPKWEVSEWSECSQTCGRGRKQRSIACKVGRETVSSLLCENPPAYFEECNLKPCPEWREIGESSCSTSCGQGVRTILFECSIPNGCTNLPKPGTTRSCNQGPCSLHQENIVDPDSSRFSWILSPSKCSVTCGKGYKKISYHCYDNHYKKYVDNSNCPKFRSSYEMVEDCFIPCIGAWVAKEWEPCSAVCGEGIETRTVICVNENNQVISDDYCSSYEKPQIERICKQSCSVEREEQWRVENWSECSVTCGQGVQYRKVFCPLGYTCPNLKPEHEKICHPRKCPEEGRWVSKGWLRCNVTCGVGYQNHSYACESLNNDPLPDESCRKAKPQHFKTCLLPRCPEDESKLKWKTSKWSPCSLDSCTKRRSVVCMSGKHPQNDSVCSKSLKRKKPNEIRACKRPSCLKNHPFGWRTGKWSECSVSCGYGRKTRHVFCPKKWQNGQRHHCTGPKPHQVANCFNDCSVQNYRWEAGPWKPCTNHCSINGQRRILKCLNGNIKVAKDHCRHLPKPERWRRCDHLKCPSCQALFDVLNSEMADGKFTIYPRHDDTPLEVYCHGVRNRQPREYITVDKRRNYAMNYSPQIRILHDCHTRCPSAYSMNYQDGYTSFSKIAINISTLSVITNDFEFSQTMRGRPVSFGEAGGCYSPTCNQGHFMINVENTGLRISRDTSWTKTPNSVLDISRADDHTWVEAYCGGCCGRCWPKHGIKLDLAPP